MTAVAEQYGQALYSLALEENISRDLLQELEVLVQSFRQEPRFLKLLSAPNLSKQERCRILDDCFRDRVHPFLLNFLKLMTEKGYLRHLEGCLAVYLRQYNADNGILPVTAISALPLQESQSLRLQEKLQQMTGKTVRLENRVDPKCLGGIRLEYDGKCIDGTVAHRLEDMAKVLKNTVI